MDGALSAPHEPLRDKLFLLSQEASHVEMDDLAGVLKLAESLKLWAEEAKKTSGNWAPTFLLQTLQIIKGLKAGRPVAQGLERALKAILEADKYMAQEAQRAALPALDTEVLVFGAQAAPKAPGPGPGWLEVKEDDLAGLKDFLQEAPGHISAIEQELLRLASGSSWDIMKVYRPFHTLKSLFGYLGFPAFAELSHQAENLLEPLKKSGEKPSEALAGRLIQVLDFYRLQVNRIQRGLEKGRIEIVPLPPLFDLIPAATAGLDAKAVALPEGPEGDERVLRIETDKMDGLMETLEEWTTYQTRVQMMSLDSAEFAPLAGTLERMGKLARKLQDQMVSLRMVSIQPLFSRVGRVVRDLSQKTGKPVRLELKGGDTYLDKRIIDRIWEPVLHLVRNAVDHGLEDAKERKTRGKSGPGGLWVRAWQQGGHFWLSLRDDGRGLDIARIERKARALGWLEEGRDLELGEAQEMIFRPGFSTAEKASEVSGRGVGLDLVKRRLETMKGTVEVATLPGEGSLFTLRVPLTLALLEGLLVRVGLGFYVIPLTQIHKFSLWANRPDKPVSALPLPRLHLAEWFGVLRGEEGNQVGVELESDKGPLLILVDEILGKREIVLKGLNPLMGCLKGVNGGAILGDGRVALVLDIPYLVRDFSRSMLESGMMRSAGKGER